MSGLVEQVNIGQERARTGQYFMLFLCMKKSARDAGLMWVGRLLLGPISIVLMVLAWQNFMIEYKAFDAASRPVVQVLQRGETGLPVFARSRWGREAILKRCYNELAGVTFGLYPAEIRSQLDTQCQRMAAHFLERTPDFALAHMVIAQRHFNSGDLEQALAHMERARSASPRENWLAAYRFDFALKYAKATRGGLPDFAAGDMDLLLEGHNGLESLARIFEANPADQEMLIAMLETKPDEAQGRFFNMIRRLRQARQGT